MSEKIIMRVGECLVAGGPPGTTAEREVAIGEMDGPMVIAFGTFLGDQVKAIRVYSRFSTLTSWCARRL